MPEGGKRRQEGAGLLAAGAAMSVGVCTANPAQRAPLPRDGTCRGRCEAGAAPTSADPEKLSSCPHASPRTPACAPRGDAASVCVGGAPASTADPEAPAPTPGHVGSVGGRCGSEQRPPSPERPQQQRELTVPSGRRGMARVGWGEVGGAGCVCGGGGDVTGPGREAWASAAPAAVPRVPVLSCPGGVLP